MAVSETSYVVGHKHSDEVKKKISIAKKGKPTKSNTVFKKGMVPWNKAEAIFIECSCCGESIKVEKNQLGRKKFCSKQCFYKGRELKGLFEVGHKDFVPIESRGHSEETKRKISEKSRASAKRGDQSPLWKGGARKERKIAMGRYEYKEWRTSVFKRDNYTCVICGAKGGYLEADHIKPWALYEALRYEVDNGRTLCKTCHINQPTHGRKALSFTESANG